MSSVRFTSRATPPVDVDPFAVSAGPPSLLVRLLRPRVVADLAEGFPPATWSPAGVPEERAWVVVALVAGVVVVGTLALAGVGVYHLARRK